MEKEPQKSNCCNADIILKEIDHLNAYCTKCNEPCSTQEPQKEYIGDGSVRCCDNGDMDEKHTCLNKPQKEKWEWEKEFDEKYAYWFSVVAVSPRHFESRAEAERVQNLYDNLPESIKSFIRSQIQATKDMPMGVSQWKEHGKKYGYWEYFEKATRQEIVEDLRNIKNPNVGSAVALSFGSNLDFMEGYLQGFNNCRVIAINQIKKAQ